MNIDQQIIDLNKKINELSVQIDNIINFTVPQRLICALHRIWHKNNFDDPKFVLPMTKSLLADMVRIEQETLSRAIKKLSHYGVSINGKTVDIYDKPRARRTVCDRCAGRDSCEAFKKMYSAPLISIHG